MYCPAHFAEPRIEILHALMRARPLATLVTLGPDGLDANHIPLLLDAAAGEFGMLRGHLARANPLWRTLGTGDDVLAIFHGPQGYVTPGWYPSKAETGKAVPTWNYAVAHAHGRLRVIDDADWLRTQVGALTDQEEATSASPWRVMDAPADYIEKMLAAVVGVEIEITRLVGKWKTSQNQPRRNRDGVAAGLSARGGAHDREMAALVAAVRDDPA
jgi:transcriptional regulator